MSDRRDCGEIVVTEYMIEDNELYVKVFKDDNFDTVHINRQEIDDIIKSYVCYKTGISEDEFDSAFNKYVEDEKKDCSPLSLIYLEELEAFFVHLYNLNSLMDALNEPEVDFSWRRLAGGMGSLVFELESGIRIEAAKLRELSYH